MDAVTEIDEIANYRRAIRFGYKIRKPSDVTEAMIVMMALDKDLESARAILLESYERLYENFEGRADLQPFVQLFHDLAYGSIPDSNLQDLTWIHLLPDGTIFIALHSAILGKDYSDYLTNCFITAANGYEEYILDPDGICLDENEKPSWLAQAFNIELIKNAGRTKDPERDADILDGMKPIYEALKKNSEHYTTGLEKQLQAFIRGQSLQLPDFIERLIRLTGYPQAAEYLPAIRKELAQFIPIEIERVRKIIKGKDKWHRMTAANIFMKCSDHIVEQVELLLKRSDVSDADKDRLREKREILRNYGTESLRKNNKSGNATGFERLFRDNKEKIHDQIKRGPNVRSIDELEKIIARDDPTIRKAIRIIRSPNVGNHNRAELLKLQKQTPEEHKHIWSDLWEEFTRLALAHASRIYDRSQSTDRHGH